MNTFQNKMKYWWTMLYCPIYLMLFYIIEHLNRTINIVSVAFDHKIPFIEYFVVPYFMWFPYIILMYMIFFFKDKEEFLSFMKYLYLGMTIFIIVSFIYPNGLDIRPKYFERDNIFTDMVKMLYANDTSTNVVPSIHAYNSIVVMVAAIKSKKVVVRRYQKVLCTVMSLLIIASTLFIKQHSIFDILSAAVLAAVGYAICYSGFGQAVKKTGKKSEALHCRS